MNIINDIITIISKYVGFCLKCKKIFETCLRCSKSKCFCNLLLEDQQMNGYLCSVCISDLKEFISVHTHQHEHH